ncbi:sorting nexin-21 [Aplochiton taeniatus]
MASRLLDRLRRSLFKDGEGTCPHLSRQEENGENQQERGDFPENWGLEDDDDECVSERLGGTLCFDCGEEAPCNEGEGSGLDSDSDFLGESLEDGASSTETSPVTVSTGGSSSLLNRQLQESWRSLRGCNRGTLEGMRVFRPQTDSLVFEVTDASMVQEGSSKYVLYTIHVIQSGDFDKTPAVITRRYSDFERLHAQLRRSHGNHIERVCFPRKKLRKNFAAETIAKRSRAFEQYLSHLHSLAAIRGALSLKEFFYLGDLQASQMLLRVERYQEALGPLLNARRLQDKLGWGQGHGQSHYLGDRAQSQLPQQSSSHWLFTLVALACCFQEVEQLEEAQDNCGLALLALVPLPSSMSIQKDRHHPLLLPLLQANVRLSWQTGRDKRQWEELLQRLEEQGEEVNDTPSLKEFLLKLELQEGEGEG